MVSPISANTSFIDRQFGIFPEALKVHEKGAVLVTNNMAHKETPNFKAQGFDFKEVLEDYKKQQAMNSKGSDTAQSIIHSDDLSKHIKYRTVTQPSANGNTVDEQVEEIEFVKNNIRYYASLHFLEYAGKSMSMAIESGRE
jgi:flagellar basal-body rod protein FlgB